MKKILHFILLTLLSSGTSFAQSTLMPAPSEMWVDDIDVSQATLRWNGNEHASAWIVGYKAFQQEAYMETTIEDTVFYLQNLASGTRYLWIVKAIDINGDTTEASPVGTFVTLGFDSDCPMIANLSLGNIDENGINVQWTASSETSQWEVVAGQVGSNPDREGSRIRTQNYEAVAGGLMPYERYQIAVRSDCSNSVSDWKYIYTKYLPYEAAQLPVQTDFENEQDYMNIGFVNSGSNAWEIGSATNAGSSGSKALYISNDNGLTNACDPGVAAISYAYIDFEIPEYAVGFYIDFKYKTPAPLQGAALKVYLLSPGSALNTDMLPSVNDQVGEGTYSGSDNVWQNVHIELPQYHIGSTKRIVFAWENTSIAATSDAVAIDDIYITARYCATPSELGIANVSFNSAVPTWEVRDNQTTFNMEYKPTESSEWILLEGVSPNTLLENLQSATQYTFRVQADCTDEQSFWSDTAVFTTNVSILPPTDVRISSFDENSANLAWSVTPNAMAWLVEVTNSNTLSTNQIEASYNEFQLTNLADNTAYSIRVRAVSSDNDTSSYSPAVYLHTLCNPIEQFPYHCEDTIKFKSDEGFCMSQDCWRIEQDTICSPMFNLSTSSNPVLMFDFEAEEGEVPLLLVSVRGENFRILRQVTSGVNTIRLNELMNEERVVFAFQSYLSDDRIYEYKITNFTIKDSCFAPDNLTANHITSNSAMLEWNVYGNNTSFDLAVANMTNEDTIHVNGVSSPYILRELTPNTEYVILLKANCGDASAENNAVISFRTAGDASSCSTPTNFICQHYQSKGDETIVCTWDEVSDNPYMRWEINYKEALAVNFASEEVNLYPRFTLRNVEQGSRWEFKLRAICAVGDTSAWTPIQTVVVGEQGLNPVTYGNTSLKIYPNPADKVLHIETDGAEIKDVQLMDANGRVLKTWESLPTEIDVSHYPNGIYYLNVSINGTRLSKKVSIQ